MEECRIVAESEESCLKLTESQDFRNYLEMAKQANFTQNRSIELNLAKKLEILNELNSLLVPSTLSSFLQKPEENNINLPSPCYGYESPSYSPLESDKSNNTEAHTLSFAEINNFHQDKISMNDSINRLNQVPIDELQLQLSQEFKNYLNMSDIKNKSDLKLESSTRQSSQALIKSKVCLSRKDQAKQFQRASVIFSNVNTKIENVVSIHSNKRKSLKRKPGKFIEEVNFNRKDESDDYLSIFADCINSINIIIEVVDFVSYLIEKTEILFKNELRVEQMKNKVEKEKFCSDELAQITCLKEEMNLTPDSKNSSKKMPLISPDENTSDEDDDIKTLVLKHIKLSNVFSTNTKVAQSCRVVESTKVKLTNSNLSLTKTSNQQNSQTPLLSADESLKASKVHTISILNEKVESELVKRLELVLAHFLLISYKHLDNMFSLDELNQNMIKGYVDQRLMQDWQFNKLDKSEPNKTIDSKLIPIETRWLLLMGFCFFGFDVLFNIGIRSFEFLVKNSAFKYTKLIQS
jgi:hypothetical protein